MNCVVVFILGFGIFVECCVDGLVFVLEFVLEFVVGVVNFLVMVDNL